MYKVAQQIGVIDYGAGNLGSVMNALGRLGVNARFVSEPGELTPGATPFERVIFPGDGNFASAMDRMTQSGYADAVRDWIKAGKPFLGICIGLQLLFETSEEAPGVAGLGVLQGCSRRFPCRKVPQIGWNQTQASTTSRLFHGLPDGAFFYYIHSYYVAPADDAVVAARADYSVGFCAAVEVGDSLCAVQFHPEKSGKAGLALLENWLRQ
jgi:imidazole glycerol phosphate synthase glutamine amidotransferase subunit